MLNRVGARMQPCFMPVTHTHTYIDYIYIYIYIHTHFPKSVLTGSEICIYLTDFLTLKRNSVTMRSPVFLDGPILSATSRITRVLTMSWA